MRGEEDVCRFQITMHHPTNEDRTGPPGYLEPMTLLRPHAGRWDALTTIYPDSLLPYIPSTLFGSLDLRTLQSLAPDGGE